MKRIVEVKGPSAGNGGTLTIDHGLGVTPFACRLAEVRVKPGRASGVSLTACSVSIEKWNEKNCYVDVYVLMGEASEATLFFEVEGVERKE